MADFETTDPDAAALSSSADLKARFEANTGADGDAGDALDLDAASAKLERCRGSWTCFWRAWRGTCRPTS